MAEAKADDHHQRHRRNSVVTVTAGKRVAHAIQEKKTRQQMLAMAFKLFDEVRAVGR